MAVAHPGQDDLQPTINAAAVQAADRVSHIAAVARLALNDSTLSADQIAACEKQLDTAEQDLQRRYRAVKAGQNAEIDLANPLMPLLKKPLQSTIADPIEAHAVMMQIVVELNLEAAAGQNPQTPSLPFRRLLPATRPTKDQQKQIDAALATLETDAAALFKGVDLNKNTQAGRDEWAKLSPKLAALSERTWADIRPNLSRDQRRAMIAAVGNK